MQEVTTLESVRTGARAERPGGLKLSYTDATGGSLWHPAIFPSLRISHFISILRLTPIMEQLDIDI